MNKNDKRVKQFIKRFKKQNSAKTSEDFKEWLNK